MHGESNREYRLSLSLSLSPFVLQSLVHRLYVGWEGATRICMVAVYLLEIVVRGGESLNSEVRAELAERARIRRRSRKRTRRTCRQSAGKAEKRSQTRCASPIGCTTHGCEGASTILLELVVKVDARQWRNNIISSALATTA